MRVISLGWGVQSFGLAAMSALGLLPKVDYAIHADTGWERTETYAFAKRWTPWLEEHAIKVVTVKSDRCGAITGSGKSILIPAFTTWKHGSRSGMLRRQCTGAFKIVPTRRWLSFELKRYGLTKTPGVVEQWIGFTHDESHRVAPNDVQYIKNKYPFLEIHEFPYTQQMVIRWLQDNNLEVPLKSSCIVCPFHNAHQWREIQLADNGDWQRAIEVDRAIRHKRPGYLCYLCEDRKPLEQHDFTRQMNLW